MCIANAATLPAEAETRYAAPAEEPQAELVVQMAEAPAPDPEPAEPAQEYYEVPLSHQLQDVVFQAAERWDVPAALLLAMMDQESDYRTDLISGTNDYGIMQINAINHPRLRRDLGSRTFWTRNRTLHAGPT